MEQATTNLRLKVIFDNNVITKSQRKEGLKRCWVLLKPQHETISDVVSYLLHSFDLLDSCPHGILLSMDGFALPPFESISILKDEDIVCVKRKGTRLLEANKSTEVAKTYIEDDVLQKQPLSSGVKLLTNKEFDEESGGYQSESDDEEGEGPKSTLSVENAPNGDVASKKRKASSKIESTRKKKQRQITPETVEKKVVDHSEHMQTPQKKKRKLVNGLKRDALSTPDAKDLNPKANSGDLEENRENTVQESGVSNREKVSRSALRKRSQRKLRNMKKSENSEQCERQQPVKNLNANSGSKIDIVTSTSEQPDEGSDGEGDLVPVVIRPGHIRFARSGKEKDFLQNQSANALDVPSTQNGAWGEQSDPNDGSNIYDNQETLCWNGIANKKKGQKWGREKQQTSSWKESRDYNNHSSSPWGTRKESSSSWKESRENGHSSGTWVAGKESTSSWKDSRDLNGHSSSGWTAGKQLRKNDSIDFDKLVPLIDLPKAGDVIAYRLLELSSSWCPELSSFRVGKITSFEQESNKILLVPDPEYPLDLPQKVDDDDDDGEPPAPSVYGEDGSLEIAFPSLVDVRIVKGGDLTQSKGTVIPAANGASVPSTSKRAEEVQNGCLNVASDVNSQELKAPAPDNGKKDVWEEISDALSAKKAEIMQEDSWKKKDASAKRSWSYRTLRGSAIGPTMARLRAQNGV